MYIYVHIITTYMYSTYTDYNLYGCGYRKTHKGPLKVRLG